MNKSALKNLALEIRREVHLTAFQRFDPLELATLYGIEVLQLSDIECSPAAQEHFQIVRPDVFSGALIPLSDGSTVIIENDAHGPERVAFQRRATKWLMWYWNTHSVLGWQTARVAESLSMSMKLKRGNSVASCLIPPMRPGDSPSMEQQTKRLPNATVLVRIWHGGA